MARDRVLIVEQPDTRGVVEFLDRATSVELAIVDGALTIRVKVMHGEAESSWDQHDFTVPLRSDD